MVDVTVPLVGGSTLGLEVSMDTPSPREKKVLLYDFFYFYFFVYILGIMLINEHPYLKGLDPPLVPLS